MSDGMRSFARYRLDTGEIVGRFTAVEITPDYTSGPLSDTGVIEHETADRDTHRVDLSDPDSPVVVEYGEAGKARKSSVVAVGHRWDPAAEDWIDERDIAGVRAGLLAEIKRYRDETLGAGFAWDGSVFDSDAAISQPRLLGLFTTAVAGGIPPEGYPWRLADNSWRVLSASDAIAVWSAFQAHMAACFAAFKVHETAILGETAIAALRVYDPTTDWPV